MALRWSVAIFSSREDPETLTSSISAVIDAVAGTGSVVDVLVNGNRALATVAARFVDAFPADGISPPPLLRVWDITLGDKAHAWNQYVSDIWPHSDIAYFVDGYARLTPKSVAVMSAALEANPKALAASGVPTVGRSARMLREEMLRGGGIHGNLYAIRGSALKELRERHFRLPLGLYRTDPLLGAVICFGLEPAKHTWDASRILVLPDATWAVRPGVWWRFLDVSSHVKRMLRQAQGRLENLAIKEHLAVRRRAPESLPGTTAELVGNFLAGASRWTRAAFARDPLCLLAARRLRRPRDWSRATVSPVLLSNLKTR